MNKVTLTNVRAVKGGKFQFEIAQAITATSLVALLNSGDDRFNAPKERRAWLSATAQGLKEHLGIDVTGLKEGEKRELNIPNPAIGGQPLNVQINEFTESEVIAKRQEAIEAGRKTSSYDFLLNNKAKAAKQIVKDEVTSYLRKNGELIFSVPSIVTGAPTHKFEKHDSLATAAELNFQEEMVAATAGVAEKAK